MNAFQPRCEIDGEVATAAQLAHIARFNHGHFTSLQVRAGGVRGLDLHLARLRDATRTLYDAPLDPQHVRDLLRHALHGIADASARINVFAPDWSVATMASSARIGVMVNILPPAVSDMRPLRLRTVEHERFLPQIKHVGTFPLFQLRADARRDGYDDALFIDRHGHISEGTIWNIGFREGDRIVWPEAPQLDGVAMQLLNMQLAAAGIVSERRTITRASPGGFDGAFVCNSNAVGQPVASIDHFNFALDDRSTKAVTELYERNPPQPV